MSKKKRDEEFDKLSEEKLSSLALSLGKKIFDELEKNINSNSTKARALFMTSLCYCLVIFITKNIPSDSFEYFGNAFFEMLKEHLKKMRDFKKFVEMMQEEAGDE